MSKVMDIFGELVFNKEVMKNRLSKNAYTQLIDIITKGESLEKEIAGEIAHSIKEWALKMALLIIPTGFNLFEKALPKNITRSLVTMKKRKLSNGYPLNS
jgi:hypothetical protein